MAVQETRTLPAPFIDKLGTDLATQITAQAQIPVVAPGVGGITQLAGEKPEDFAKRQQAAEQFAIRQQSLAGLAPQVEGLSQFEQDARTRAQAGLGSFEPFIQSAQTQAGAAAQGLGAIPLGAPTSAVVERECNSQSLAQGQREKELYYRQDSCNKDLDKQWEQDNKTLLTDLVLPKHNKV
jgi:hypothetical protein